MPLPCHPRSSQARVLATAVYVGCFQDPGCGSGNEAEGEMKLLLEDESMTPVYCWHLAQVGREQPHMLPDLLRWLLNSPCIAKQTGTVARIHAQH
jgi:hypothetical protein